MNSDLTTKLCGILDSLQTAAGSVLEAAKQHAPELCRQIVAYELWSNAVPAAICLLVSVLAFSALLWALAREVGKGDDEYGEDFLLMVSLISFVAFVAAFVIGCIHAINCIKPLSAPDLVILDYVKSAIGK